MPKGKFIVFEGIDGSGKSTQISLLKKYLESKNILCYVTSEPTDSPIGSLIHQCMTGRIDTDDKTIAGLFVADRLDHLYNKTNGILAKIRDGYTVISDRYYFSSYAYHGVSMPIEWVIAANRLSAEALKPDINIFLDADPIQCSERLLNRDNIERYEHIDIMYKVREKYLESFSLFSLDENIIVVDGNESVEKIMNNIRRIIDELYK